MGRPAYIHLSFDEIFFVLEGELVFQVADELTRLGVGEWLLASHDRMTDRST